jgi:hypothetical protein
MTYYSTFPSGLTPVAEDALHLALPDAKVLSSLDGALVYGSSAPPQRIAALRFFVNSFVVLAAFRELRAPRPLDAMARQVGAGRTGALGKMTSTIGRGTFRVVASVENRLVHLAPSLLGAVETRIKSATGSIPARSAARHEYWLLTRSEGSGFFLWRATKRRGTHGTLHAGELQPEVAHLLCVMSGPSASDVFLDPFCGWGSIVIERARSFPFRSIGGSDVDRAKVEAVTSRLGGVSSRGVVIRQADATRLDGIDDRSIDVVVTDPPWGEYDRQDVAGLYARFLDRLQSVLRPEGRVILLLARSGAAWDAVESSPFRVADRHDMLLSGKKAAAVRLVRR